MTQSRGEFLYRSAIGVDYYLRREPDGSVHCDGYQDVQHILDHNGNMMNENSGWNKDKTMRRAASIPMNLISQWKAEDGFDALRAVKDDPKALAKRLNDGNWLKLRTAHWRM